MVEIYLLENEAICIRGKLQKVYINPPATGQKAKKENDHPIFLFSKGQKPPKLNDGFVIFGPGEYEFEGVEFLGLRGKDKETIYQIKIDGVYICHLGALGGKLTQDQIEELSQVDLLIVGVGGEGMSPKIFLETVQSLEPKILIPLPKTEKALGVLFNELGKPIPDAQAKISIHKEKLPEELEVVLLKESI